MRGRGFPRAQHTCLPVNWIVIEPRIVAVAMMSAHTDGCHACTRPRPQLDWYARIPIYGERNVLVGRAIPVNRAHHARMPELFGTLVNTMTYGITP